MSLVNDMLRDLEARQATHELRSSLGGINPVPARTAAAPGRMAALAGASALALAIGGWLYWEQRANPHAPTAAPATATHPAAPAPRESAPAPQPTPAAPPAQAQAQAQGVSTTTAAAAPAQVAPAAGPALLAALPQRSAQRFSLQLVLDSAVAWERSNAPDGVLYRLPRTHFAPGRTENHFEEGPIVVTWVLEPEGDGMRLAIEGTSGLDVRERLEPSGQQWQLWVEIDLPPEPAAPAVMESAGAVAALEPAAAIAEESPAAQQQLSIRPHGGTPPAAEAPAGGGSLSIQPTRALARAGGPAAAAVTAASAPAPRPAAPASAPRSALAEGREAYHAGDYALAAERFSELQQAQPHDIELARWLARAQLAAGQREELRAWLEPRLGEFSDQSELRTLLARALLEGDDAAGAVAALAEGAPAVASDPEYHALLGAACQQAGDWPCSLDTYAQLVALDSGNTAWKLGLAIAEDQSGRAYEAIRHYTEALASPDLEDASRRYARMRLNALVRGR